MSKSNEPTEEELSEAMRAYVKEHWDEIHRSMLAVYRITKNKDLEKVATTTENVKKYLRRVN